MGAAGPAGAEWSHFETEARSHESARALGSHRHQLAAEGGGGSSPALQFYSSLTSRSQLSSSTVLQFYSSPALQFLDISSPALVLASSSYNYIAIIRGGIPGQALICRETSLQLLISFYQPCLPWCLVERTKRYICSNSFHRSK